MQLRNTLIASTQRNLNGAELGQGSGAGIMPKVALRAGTLSQRYRSTNKALSPVTQGPEFEHTMAPL